MKTIELKPKKDAAVLRFHPWIFSGAIARQPDKIEDGEWVEVLSHEGRFLGVGHFQHGSISVRLLSFKKTAIDQAFWDRKLQQALSLRQAIGMDPAKDSFRLVHAEGDGLPGLIIDLYAGVAVMQCHSIGMHLDRKFIAQALQTLLGDALQAVYDKSVETLPAKYASTCRNEYLFGKSSATVIEENGHSFQVDWESGQKTGFFLDQRDNRALAARYAAGKTVLNAFCYTGGFSVYALAAGAAFVDSVDASHKAIALASANIQLNGASPDRHQETAEDVLVFLRQTKKEYDLMIVDPPAFAKSLDKRHNAIQGYKRLNALAMSKMARGGILFTFSCSQVVDKQVFYDTIVAAALEARRQVRVLHELSQPADHPVSMFHPEGGYLKGLVLYIE